MLYYHKCLDCLTPFASPERKVDTCDCACGGANHGTGRVVNVVVAEGKVKVVDPSEDVYNDMVRGYKYREVRDYADALYTKLFGAADYWNRDARYARMELDKIKSLKVYDRRQQELINWIGKHYVKE